jgi:hypothetical protein
MLPKSLRTFDDGANTKTPHPEAAELSSQRSRRRLGGEDEGNEGGWPDCREHSGSAGRVKNKTLLTVMWDSKRDVTRQRGKHHAATSFRQGTRI